ncbi:hypothetical protein [Herpetosiphon giganteus]|uniref:hypothetical protein n=1 Tax=Herpetosiphon giganteus TaxID=2029754 RepID=UPI00195DF365|nr:hypothetical protein [Herpetosiphon giganteus]MBM7846343.1 hypothetical protein [Herpetosiphon giganteus]
MSHATSPALASKPKALPIAAIVMLVGSLIMVVGLFLPYVSSNADSSINVSVIDVLKEESDLVQSGAKVLYALIAGSVGLSLLLSALALTGKKVWGWLAVILSFIIAGFNGLMALMPNEGKSVQIDSAATVIAGAALVVFAASIGFLIRKKPVNQA